MLDVSRKIVFNMGFYKTKSKCTSTLNGISIVLAMEGNASLYLKKKTVK